MTSHNLVISDLEPAATDAEKGRSEEQQVAYSIAVSLKRIADHYEREAPPRPAALAPRKL